MLCLPASSRSLMLEYSQMCIRDRSSKVQFDEDMVIDYSSRIVFYHNKDMAFTKKEFDIISFLSQNKGIVFDRETIYEKVWGLEMCIRDSIQVNNNLASASDCFGCFIFSDDRFKFF